MNFLKTYNHISSITFHYSMKTYNHISSITFHYSMKTYNHISSITFHYSIPGHSAVQEVDNMHSNIEKTIRASEFFSPVSFLCVSIKTHRVNPYRVMQMMPKDFKDYHTCAKMLQYNKIPYMKVMS